MGLIDLLRRSPKADTSLSLVDSRSAAREKMMAAAASTGYWVNPAQSYRGEKHGRIEYPHITSYNYTVLRRNARGVYRENLMAGGMVGRLDESVINTGLTWESTPMWDLIPDAPKSDEEKAAWTRNTEARWKLYANSTEADIEGTLTFNQIQSLAFRESLVDGEKFGILRYLNSPRRMSPLALQFARSEQVVNPTNYAETRKIEEAGGSVEKGIEKDKVGKIVAIHILDAKTYHTKRFPIHGPKSHRRFVIHHRNYENSGEVRGFPELSSMVHELSKLTTYSVAELEAALTQSAIAAMLEVDKDASPGKGKNLFRPAGENKVCEAPSESATPGIERAALDAFALVLDKLPPGYTFKGFSPTRPNTNYEKFVESFETRICARLNMPRSVFAEKFQASYSAARTEILFFWNSVVKRRADFVAGFIAPYSEAWFCEEVAAGRIKAPGFFQDTLIRHAWLYGSWDGIGRPVVDPVKEAKAVAMRIEMGHTTGEREAKAYNGSDFRENVERLRKENKVRSWANEPLKVGTAEEGEGEEKDEEDENDSDVEVDE